jgi:hypothetical protein
MVLHAFVAVSSCTYAFRRSVADSLFVPFVVLLFHVLQFRLWRCFLLF